MDGKHSGANLAMHILSSLDWANITLKVHNHICLQLACLEDYPYIGHFMLDNAKNNVTVMQALQKELKKHKHEKYELYQENSRLF